MKTAPDEVPHQGRAKRLIAYSIHSRPRSGKAKFTFRLGKAYEDLSGRQEQGAVGDLTLILHEYEIVENHPPTRYIMRIQYVTLYPKQYQRIHETKG